MQQKNQRHSQMPGEEVEVGGMMEAGDTVETGGMAEEDTVEDMAEEDTVEDMAEDADAAVERAANVAEVKITNIWTEHTHILECTPCNN